MTLVIVKEGFANISNVLWQNYLFDFEKYLKQLINTRDSTQIGDFYEVLLITSCYSVNCLKLEFSLDEIASHTIYGTFFRCVSALSSPIKFSLVLLFLTLNTGTGRDSYLLKLFT